MLDSTRTRVLYEKGLDDSESTLEWSDDTPDPDLRRLDLTDGSDEELPTHELIPDDWELYTRGEYLNHDQSSYYESRKNLTDAAIDFIRLEGREGKHEGVKLLNNDAIEWAENYYCLIPSAAEFMSPKTCEN